MEVSLGLPGSGTGTPRPRRSLSGLVANKNDLELGCRIQEYMQSRRH